MSKIIAYTDGACKGNPGPGGWGYTASIEKLVTWEGYGGDINTTNNRMELMGVIRLLERVAVNIPLHVYSDSEYVVKGLTLWRAGWEKKSMRGVKNDVLWKRLFVLADGRKEFAISWIKGHAGHPGNERADYLSNFFLGRGTEEHTVKYYQDQLNTCRNLGMKVPDDELREMTLRGIVTYTKEQLVDTIIIEKKRSTRQDEI